MLYLRHIRMGYELFERERASQTVFIVHNVDIIDLVHILGLHPHLPDTFRHTPILVNHDHLRTHESAGCVLVIFQEVYDVTGLFHIVYVGKNLVAVFLVKFLNDVYRVIRVKMLYLFGDILGIHLGKEARALVLVKLHEHISLCILVKKKKQILGLVNVKVAIEVGYIRRMEISKFVAGGIVRTILYDFM